MAQTRSHHVRKHHGDAADEHVLPNAIGEPMVDGLDLDVGLEHLEVAVDIGQRLIALDDLARRRQAENAPDPILDGLQRRATDLIESAERGDGAKPGASRRGRPRCELHIAARPRLRDLDAHVTTITPTTRYLVSCLRNNFTGSGAYSSERDR